MCASSLSPAPPWLQESLAEYVILWDDDIKPSPGCVAAYVEAFWQHPQVMRGAGAAAVALSLNRYAALACFAH